LAARYEVSPDIHELVTRDWTADEFSTAAVRRQELHETLHAVFADHDVLLTPSTATPAFPLGLRRPADHAEGIADGAQWSPFAFPFNLTGQPAASLPIGRTPAGLPVGLQLTGPRLADPLLLQIAHTLEQALAG
jgi:aspartyl-tRNA(Asn)/glutamyl-tRNA(Gln) amidotransferase subunit A